MLQLFEFHFKPAETRPIFWTRKKAQYRPCQMDHRDIWSKLSHSNLIVLQIKTSCFSFHGLWALNDCKRAHLSESWGTEARIISALDCYFHYQHWGCPQSHATESWSMSKKRWNLGNWLEAKDLPKWKIEVVKKATVTIMEQGGISGDNLGFWRKHRSQQMREISHFEGLTNGSPNNATFLKMILLSMSKELYRRGAKWDDTFSLNFLK